MSAQPRLQRVYTIKGAAVVAEVNPRTIWREIWRNRLKAVKVGSQWRIRAEDLDAYLNGEKPSRPNDLERRTTKLVAY